MAVILVQSHCSNFESRTRQFLQIGDRSASKRVKFASTRASRPPQRLPRAIDANGHHRGNSAQCGLVRLASGQRQPSFSMDISLPCGVRHVCLRLGLSSRPFDRADFPRPKYSRLARLGQMRYNPRDVITAPKVCLLFPNSQSPFDATGVWQVWARNDAGP